MLNMKGKHLSNKDSPKLKFLGIVLIIIVISLIFLIGNKKLSNSNKISSSSNETIEEEVPQYIKDRLESKTFTITNNLKELLKNNSITNINFSYVYCSSEDSYYKVVYLLYQDDTLTASMLTFYYSKNNEELSKVSYHYNFELVSSNLSAAIIDEKTNILILANLPYVIDGKAFAKKSYDDIINILANMYENHYTFSSGYKISVSYNYMGNLYIYDFEKLY